MKHRIVIVEKEKCNPEGCGGYLCARVSPSNRAGKEAFYKDADGKIGVNETLVNEMDKVAVHKCPFQALKMVKLPEELNEAPVHRYGKNAFELYKLPIPLNEKVVGIIGRNGIGKSTAVKILAGVLKPNLGRVDDNTLKREDPTMTAANASRGEAPTGDAAPTTEKQEASRASSTPEYDALIEHFKGNEAQGYFERLRDKKITLSYKPQQVEQLPKAYTGRVDALLRKANEQDEETYKNVLETLQLTHLQERALNVLSGGELQRVAIAATALKKANVLFYDEPTSYLDIKQRVKTAHFLKSQTSTERAVMVVDHDLIILDYMTELVHLLYGNENAYGITSQPKATKAGMNTYLSGYLKEENVRFRNNAITFPKHAFEGEREDDETVAEWPAMKEKLGTFTLTAGAGTIKKHDVVGIVGENGIGKTTFVRKLATLQGRTARGELRVSLKPQYLEETSGYDSEKTVAEYVADAMSYEHQLVTPLDLKPLYQKRLSQLSGGQLQRVTIARALAADADLYLLDEPSAYLDVEQRLLMSKIIKEMMEAKGKACLVVDHDLLFIDYLSEKLIVFEGKPGTKGTATGPFPMQEGMNKFLKDLNITFRRDDENNRPRANKAGSVKDREQKANGNLYYAS